MNAAAFETSEIRDRFQEFGIWLCQTIGPQPTAIKLHRYLSFFLQIEHQWKSIPPYEELLHHFGTPKLRQVLVILKWMEQASLIVKDSKAAKDDSDRRRILASIEQFPQNSGERALLESYRTLLQKKLEAGKTSLCSVRLAMRAASGLLATANNKQEAVPTQATLTEYITQKPGQKAAVSGFVCYLREKFQTQIFLPKIQDMPLKSARKKRLEKELLELMKHPQETEKFRREWISVSLSFFHDLPKKVGRIVRDENIKNVGDGLEIQYQNVKYWIGSFNRLQP